MIAAPTGASWSTMIRSHFSQLPESRAHVARCASRISSALGIAPPAARAPSTVGQPVEDDVEPAAEALVDGRGCKGRHHAREQVALGGGIDRRRRGGGPTDL